LGGLAIRFADAAGRLHRADRARPELRRTPAARAVGLRKITDPARLPDLQRVAIQFYDPGFQEALGHSINWFAIPSTTYHYPSGPITHEQAWASVVALRELAEGGRPHEQLVATLRQKFDIYESIGWDGPGEVLFTGYYAPQFQASYTRRGLFQHPIYTRPADLITDPLSGEVVGRRIGNRVVPYPTRAQIEQNNVLAGKELAYLPSRLDAYTIEVNGSAKLRMTDGSELYVGYAGTNGHDYVSIGKRLVADGKIDEDKLSMPAIRRYFAQHPGELEHYIRQNPRMVFFKEYDGGNWPAGSLGVPVTTMRSLATDKSIFPRGSAVLVETMMPQAGPGGARRPFHQLMLDQDTGGAIRAAGRADIFCGIGAAAEQTAGNLIATGRMYYLLLKPQYIAEYRDQLQPRPALATP
jgi:membrane-bound lytic murein transglycosylase A